MQDSGYQTSLVGKKHLFYNYTPTKDEAEKISFELVDSHDGKPNVDPFSAYYKWREKNDTMKDVYNRTLAKDEHTIKNKIKEIEDFYSPYVG